MFDTILNFIVLVGVIVYVSMSITQARLDREEAEAEKKLQELLAQPETFEVNGRTYIKRS